MTKTRSLRSSGSSTKKNHMKHKATFHGLHKWYESTFEKLGWMILAKKHGYHEKIMVYKMGIQHLKMALEEKIKSVQEKDRKDDLKIMLDNVLTLEEHVSKDFADIA
jgi:predicted ATP-binding protein involved in virulence